MWLYSLAKPSPQDINQFLTHVSSQHFSYDHMGATLTDGPFPKGWDVDHNFIELGYGRETFDAACQALESWAMFDLGWVKSYPPMAPILKGTIVAVVARAYGLWVKNAARIFEAIDSIDGHEWIFGFTYGTLASHVEAGEERFTIRWNLHSDIVSYDILAFSRPRSILVRMGYFFARRMQRKFARDSKNVMKSRVLLARAG